jgi:hypothetical protein
VAEIKAVDAARGTCVCDSDEQAQNTDNNAKIQIAAAASGSLDDITVQPLDSVRLQKSLDDLLFVLE